MWILSEFIIIYKKFIVENERVIEIHGIFTRNRITIPFMSISNITSKKTILGRLLDYGDVSIIEISGREMVMRGVSSPNKILEKLEIITENMKKKRIQS